MDEGLIQHPGSLLMLVLSQCNNIVSLSMFHFAMLMHSLLSRQETVYLLVYMKTES